MARTWALLASAAAAVLACDAHAGSSAAASTSSSQYASPASAVASPSPVLVELFTSEGCSSCPAADERLSTLGRDGAGGVPVIVLGLHVDYWDELGWKDTFGSPAWTLRQRAYARSFGRGVYTPQAVVDGADEFTGSDANATAVLVRRAAARPKASLALARGPAPEGELGLSVRVTSLPALAPGDSADVLAAVTEDGVVDSIARGENAGKRLTLAPVVLSLDTLGPATNGQTATRIIHLPPRSAARALRVVAFVQERSSQHVLGATAVPLASL